MLTFIFTHGTPRYYLCEMPNTKMNEIVPITNGFIIEPQTLDYANSTIFSKRLMRQRETETTEMAGQVSPPPIHSASTSCKSVPEEGHTHFPAPHTWTQYLNTPRPQYSSSIYKYILLK